MIQKSLGKNPSNQRKSTGTTFLNGEHYLVDAFGNLMKMKENGDAPILVPNRRKDLYAYHIYIL